MYSLFNTLSKIKQQHCVTLATHFSHALARWSRDVHKDISSIPRTLHVHELADPSKDKEQK